MIFIQAMLRLAPSAAWRLVEALGSLHEPSGRVRIPGFYDAVRLPTESERRLMARFPIETPVPAPELEGRSAYLDPGDDPVALTEHLLYAPTCNICGMWSGYQGPGGKTVLPATAGAKLDFRLVPDQEPGTILTLLRRHLAEQGFGDVEVISLEASSRPAQSSLETPLVDCPCPFGPLRVWHRTPRVTTQARLRPDGGTLPAIRLAGR